MPVTFNVRNLPYIQGDDPYYAEALQDLIQQVSALQQTLQQLQATVTSLESRITALGG